MTIIINTTKFQNYISAPENQNKNRKVKEANN